MQILELEQGSDEWLEIRDKFVTSTDTPIIMRSNKNKTVAQLWRQKKGIEPFEEANEKMLEGKLLEKMALDWYNKEHNTNFQPVCIISDEYPWMFTSLDGYDKDTNEILEIKCGEASYAKALEGIIDNYYLDQSQHHICVSEKPFCRYLAFRPDKKPVELLIGRNESRIKEITKRTKEFHEYLINDECPFDEKALLAIVEKSSNEQASRWALAKLQAEEYIKKEKEEREKLFDLTDDGNCLFVEANVKVLRINKLGSIDYKKLLKDLNIAEETLEKYRKPEVSYLQPTIVHIA